ncbi:LEA type 2 family protein [beta proteobacterium MWH-UniP1]
MISTNTFWAHRTPLRSSNRIQGLAGLGRTGLIAAMLVFAALLAGCGSALKKPTVEVADARVANFDRDTAQFTVTLKVDNPNSTELTISDIQAKFFLVDEEVGTAEGTQPKYILPANGSVMLPVRVNVTFKTLPDVLRKSLIALVSGGLPYKISGSITTFNGLTTIPFERKGDLAKPR